MKQTGDNYLNLLAKLTEAHVAMEDSKDPFIRRANEDLSLQEVQSSNRVNDSQQSAIQKKTEFLSGTSGLISTELIARQHFWKKLRVKNANYFMDRHSKQRKTITIIETGSHKFTSRILIQASDIPKSLLLVTSD